MIPWDLFVIIPDHVKIISGIVWYCRVDPIDHTAVIEGRFCSLKRPIYYVSRRFVQFSGFLFITRSL